MCTRRSVQTILTVDTVTVHVWKEQRLDRRMKHVLITITKYWKVSSHHIIHSFLVFQWILNADVATLRVILARNAVVLYVIESC